MLLPHSPLGIAFVDSSKLQVDYNDQIGKALANVQEMNKVIGLVYLFDNRQIKTVKKIGISAL
ncbi:hypothetical protein [Candidatus Enterovibrio escicola]|uniref:Mobile element protein n=1 Tax=Candidatus Enterovibrio escicola TaxID=1927127 RepID=A0A2A5T2E0_9GAMM|nr:hypothetical protein [Candidatus Enterovibrio escacola]PCS22314.1 hypothetical protein BTN49_2043 [Candidatus Enterovibrio escacola]